MTIPQTATHQMAIQKILRVVRVVLQAATLHHVPLHQSNLKGSLVLTRASGCRSSASS